MDVPLSGDTPGLPPSPGARSAIATRTAFATPPAAPSDRELVALAAASYREHTFVAGNVEALYRVTPGWRALAFTGTQFDFADIVADLRAVPWWDPDLGWCHAGILKGVRDAFWPLTWAHLLAAGQAPLWVVGHSKGGGAALIFAGKARAIGGAVAGVVTFGAPMVLGARGRRLLAGAGAPEVRQFKNGDDLVPCVPALLGALGVVGHARALTPIGRAHGERDGPYFDHRIADYDGAIAAREAAALNPGVL